MTVSRFETYGQPSRSARDFQNLGQVLAPGQEPREFARPGSRQFGKHRIGSQPYEKKQVDKHYRFLYSSDMLKIRISSTELARSIGDVLNRVRYRGESFIIERNGKEIAFLSPHQKPVRRSLRDVLRPWLQAAGADPEWANLLEKTGREDAPPENPWESSSIQAP